MKLWESQCKGNLQGETLATPVLLPVDLGLDGNPEAGQEVRGGLWRRNRGEWRWLPPSQQAGAQPPGPGPAVAAHPHVLTLIAVPHGAEVHVVLVVGEEEEAEPGVEGVDGHDEEDADDVALLVGAAVAAQVHVDLGAEGLRQWGPSCHGSAPLTPLRP